MPREFVHAGNPINLGTKCTVETPVYFPLRCEDPAAEESRLTRRYLFILLSFPLIHLAAMYVYVGSPELATLRIGLLVFVLIVLIAAKKEHKSVLRIVMPPVLFAAFVPTLTFPLHLIPYVFILAICATASLAYAVRIHYPSVTLETGFAQFCPAREEELPAYRLAFLDMFVSFLTYGTSYAPGMTQSAAGDSRTRLTIAVVAFLTVFYACILAAVNVIPIASHSMDGFHLVFVFIAIVLAHLMPVLVVIAAPAFAALPFVRQCYAAKQAEAEPGRLAECFPDLVNALISQGD